MTLYLITHTSDDLTRALLPADGSAGAQESVVMDLTEGTVDYKALVEAVFAADAVHVI